MTELDDDIIPEVWDMIQELGILATFREYLALDGNTDLSEVAKGAPTDYTVKVSPPQSKVVEIMGELETIEKETQEVYLPTGSGTPDAISFVPTLSSEATSMTCIIGGQAYSIVRIDPLVSGEYVAAYQLYLTRR